jgi:hypothetical protein
VTAQNLRNAASNTSGPTRQPAVGLSECRRDQGDNGIEDRIEE